MPYLWHLSFRKLLILLLAIVLFAGFSSLGTWQLQRRAWKLDLVARVDRQLAKEPVPAPGRSEWGSIGQDYAYLPVTVSGSYQYSGEVLVQALTTLGSGYWVMTPLRTSDGAIVLINRGFVDQLHRTAITRQSGPVKVKGLLRLSEPDGRFLRPNKPTENRWYSRDVMAISKAEEIPAENLAPYFIDADATANSDGWPVGGLTVVKFRNTHLVYAITWYALALLTVVAARTALRKPAQESSV